MTIHGALLALLAGIAVTYLTWTLAARNEDGRAGTFLGLLLGVLTAATIVTWDIGI